MKILLSAYSCRPHIGSEPGVGWHYAVKLAELDNEVWVLTKKTSQKLIEQESLPSNLHFIYYDLPKWTHRYYKTATISEHIYYFFWQLGVFFTAKKFLKQQDIDLIHHITIGVFRTPVFLCFLNKPFVFGPVGGGENYAIRLKRKFPFKYLMVELARDLVNLLFSLNPLFLLTLSKSSLILCRTRDTLRYVPKKFRHKCVIDMGIGYHASWKREFVPPTHKEKGLKLLYAGRPLYWKGIHIVIQSLAALKKRGEAVSLTIVGSGDPGWAKEVASKHGIIDSIRWLGRVELEELHHLYRTSDFLLFPSLREAGGTVAIEALSFGLPVVCLALGGPGGIVNNACGCVIPVKNRDEAQIVNAIADAIQEAHQSGKLACMKEAAYQEADQYEWGKVVKRTYSYIKDYLQIRERTELV